MNYGFVKVASAVPSVKVADCRYNILQIESLIAQAEGKGIEVICFPELSITAYTCGDLFSQQLLLDDLHGGVDRNFKRFLAGHRADYNIGKLARSNAIRNDCLYCAC